MKILDALLARLRRPRETTLYIANGLLYIDNGVDPFTLQARCHCMDRIEMLLGDNPVHGAFRVAGSWASVRCAKCQRRYLPPREFPES